MKKAEIKSWDCTDHDPIEKWEPSDRSQVEFWCNLSIGIVGEDGADNFQVHIVCENIVSQLNEKKYLVTIPYYEGWENVMEILSNIVSSYEGHNWSSISEQLSKVFYWEYEGYNA